MKTQIEDLTLIKFLGKGSYGEVYLTTKKGRKGYFATKKMERKIMDEPSVKKYFDNEINILNSLNHPNIVKLEELKKTKDHYYLVMEYVNGGNLTDCLRAYQKKYGSSFPEDIVQYLMRQIVDAVKYIHSKEIIHRDLKLDNIMVNFNNEEDKKNGNMMNSKIKIIDFGLSTYLPKSALTFTALGSPINMDPVILQKFSKKGIDLNKVGYDSKADIWSLGTICYELLIGEAVFNAETLNDLVRKVEKGSYSVPTSVSREVVSFLNGMLQYKGEKRMSAEELSKHPFLTKNINSFSRINTRKVSRKINDKGLNINVKNNQTIWAIFNEEDEKKLAKIKGDNKPPQKPPVPPKKDINPKNKNNNQHYQPKQPKQHYQNNQQFQKDKKKKNPEILQKKFSNDIFGDDFFFPQNFNFNIEGMHGNQQLFPNHKVVEIRKFGGNNQIHPQKEDIGDLMRFQRAAKMMDSYDMFFDDDFPISKMNQRKNIKQYEMKFNDEDVDMELCSIQ